MVINRNSELVSKVITALYIGKLDTRFREQGYSYLTPLKKEE